MYCIAINDVDDDDGVLCSYMMMVRKMYSVLCMRAYVLERARSVGETFSCTYIYIYISSTYL